MRNVFLFVLALTFVACAEEEKKSSVVDELACGIVVCAEVDEDPNFDPNSVVVDPEGGKADAADEVSAKLFELTADGDLNVSEVRAIYEAAGAKLSPGEAAVIRDGIAEGTVYTVLPEAKKEAYTLARVSNITNADEVALLTDGRSFSGTEIPEAVQEVVALARLNGAVAYDVRERGEDGEQIWTHYPSISPAVGNMAFEYTEISPAALQADLDDKTAVYNAIVGTEQATTSTGVEYTTPRYEQRTGGTGNVTAYYDELYHPDLFARGEHGQKWANNFAILSDGTLHCLPAVRRDVNQRVILTNPALAREKFILYNGHINVLGGVVTDIELSGALSKLAGKGKANFIDPIPLLEAWGYKMEDGLRVRWGNTTSGTPIQENYVITAPKEVPVP